MTDVPSRLCLVVGLEGFAAARKVRAHNFEAMLAHGRWCGDCGGIYLRTTRRKNTNCSIVRYIKLAQNRRVNPVTRAEVLVNLGRDDRFDREDMRRLVASINRYLGNTDDGDDVERVSFALVADRAIDPLSKLVADRAIDPLSKLAARVVGLQRCCYLRS